MEKGKDEKKYKGRIPIKFINLNLTKIHTAGTGMGVVVEIVVGVGRSSAAITSCRVVSEQVVSLVFFAYCRLVLSGDNKVAEAGQGANVHVVPVTVIA